ncbi:MAG: OsmC family protein [Fimbriimonadaceae bacterium]|nr:OsmC family protein [Fimbriimonadaceae bacterium]
MVKVDWIGGMAFRATGDSGGSFTMDSLPETGGQSLGVSPVEALLASAAACSGMDVVSILVKKRQKLTSYRLEVEGVRPSPGEWPRPFESITLTHILAGEDLDPVAVERAVELSDEKYCTVVTTLRRAPTVTSKWEIADDPVQ